MAISFNATALLNGNGIDVKAVVNAILNQQTGPLTTWQNQQTDLSTQAGLLSGLNNNLTTLAATVLSLADPHGPLASQSAVSSLPNVLTATAQNSAPAGSHQIVVTSLATSGTLFTNPLASGDTSFLADGVTSADIALQVGGVDGEIHDIAIAAGVNDTISSLADYINSQDFGVSASVVTDVGGARLALFSQSTGTPGGLSIAGNNSNLTFNAPLGGANAVLTIDGVPVNSASNTVTGAINGVTLNLLSALPGTAVQLNVGPDTAAATGAINSFVDAYNSVIGIINKQFTVNAATNTQGPLGADSTLRTLQSRLLSDVTYSITGNSGLVNLASLGIDLNNDGTLSLNTVATDIHPALGDVLKQNPSAVQSFFADASNSGFANNFNLDLFSLTDTTDGIVNLDIAGNKAQQKSLAKQITALQDRLSAQQAQLTSLYARVNATLESYPSLLFTVTAIIGALNGNFNVAPPSSNTTPNTGTSTR